MEASPVLRHWAGGDSGFRWLRPVGVALFFIEFFLTRLVVMKSKCISPHIERERKRENQITVVFERERKERERTVAI